MVDSIVESFYMLINFFACLSIITKKVLKSDYNSEFAYFSLQFYQYLLYIFWGSVIRYTNI